MALSSSRYLFALQGIVVREVLRFIKQRERFVASMVRPILWFVVFAAGLRGSLELAPDAFYLAALSSPGQFSYEMYLLPGLVAMIQLFSGMQSALSMVFDREMGSMRVLLVSPLPRSYLLFCKLFAGSVISLLQITLFLLFASFFDIGISISNVLLALPLLLLGGLCCGSIGLYLSSLIKQLENFAGIMNFVIFPLFFLSSALYPLSNFQEGSPLLYYLAQLNPFTHIVEMLRHALFGELKFGAVVYVSLCFLLFSALASRGYNPSRGMMKKKFS